MTNHVTKFTSVGGNLLSSLSTGLMALLAFSSIIQYSYFAGIKGKCGTPQASIVFCLFFYGTILLASSYGGWKLCKITSGRENFARHCFVWTRAVFVASAIVFGFLCVVGLL